MRDKLSDRLAKTAPAGIIWDTHPHAPRGFLLQVTAGGSRAFRLNYRRQSDGVERRLTIGDIAAWPIAEARKRAAELRRIVDAGGDPLGEAQEKRAAPTMAELIQDYLLSEEFMSRAPGTQINYRTLLNVHILPALGSRKVASVERADIEKLHRAVTARGTARQANAVKTMLRTLFGIAIKSGLRADNPATGIKGNPEHHRERYLTAEEFDRLLAVLDRWQEKRPDSCDSLRLLMLTGARRGEVLGMTWEQIDLDAGVWSKPHATTKQRKAHRVPLSPEAVELLRRRFAERDEPGRVVRLRRGDGHVFKGGGDTAHEARLERDWRVIRAAAGLEDVRIHDLRHSYASVLVGQGLSLPIIGALLGHSKPATTSRYAHLADQPLRAATAIVGALFTNAKK